MARRRKRSLILIRDLCPGMEVDSYFFVHQSSPTSGNGPRLRARIWDRTGEATLISWSWEPGLTLPDGAYRIIGSVDTYAGNIQVCAERVEPCPPDIDLQELLPAAPRPIPEMWADLSRFCEKCGDTHLRALLILCLAEEDLCERWKRAPAAVRHHHAYTGGLLEHTLGVVGLAVSLGEHFPALDRDLLLAGAVLHDIGKTEAYTATGLPDMTDQGRLLGHVYPGIRIVEGILARLPDFPAELRMRLLHLIGSHHGERQFGVLEVPKTPEAILLHHADNLDAKMNAVLAACEQARGQLWTQPIRSLDNERVYLGGRSDASTEPAPEGIMDQLAEEADATVIFEGLFADDALEE